MDGDGTIPHVNGVPLKRSVPVADRTSLLQDRALASARNRCSTGLGCDIQKVIDRFVAATDANTPTTRYEANFSPMRLALRWLRILAYADGWSIGRRKAKLISTTTVGFTAVCGIVAKRRHL